MAFRLEGSNDERACSFEFIMPGEAVGLAQQAELRLASEERVAVPVQITPYTRRLIGLRQRTYPFTISATLLERQQTPHSQLGRLNSRPLIGPLWLLLIGLMLTVVIAIIARPRIDTFKLADGGTAALVNNGTPVAMFWKASFFTTDLNLEPRVEELELPLRSQDNVVTYPKTDTVYTLTGSNFLSRLIPPLFPTPNKSIRIDVRPIPPQIIFEAQPKQVIGTGVVTLRWQVQFADKVELFRKVGSSGGLEAIADVSGQSAGTLQVTPEPDQSEITYVLVASNTYVPTATPVPQRVTVLTPTPHVVFFTANPSTINEGERSALAWQVVGVQQVTIQGIPGSSIYPDQGSAAVQPTGSADYVLSVPGAPPLFTHIEVTPATPTPTSTPLPTAPEIKFFVPDPTELVKGDESQVKLTWSVVGTTTNVEISGPTLNNPLSNLANDGAINVPVDKTTQFVLTAFNKEAKVSKTVEIKVTEPTPTTTPQPTATATPIPAEILSFEILLNSPKIQKIDNTNYKIQDKTNATFTWSVNSAAVQAILAEGGSPVGQGVPIGQVTTQVTGSGTKKTYVLTAENDKGTKVSRSIIVEIITQPPPDPPFNVSGTETVDTRNTITWNWIFNPDKSDIVGFRIYTSNGGPYTPIPGAD
ncbi:MAG: hypothetical protein AB1801_27670, partial [Chloroflexota bacterium]